MLNNILTKKIDANIVQRVIDDSKEENIQNSLKRCYKDDLYEEVYFVNISTWFWFNLLAVFTVFTWKIEFDIQVFWAAKLKNLMLTFIWAFSKFFNYFLKWKSLN